MIKKILPAVLLAGAAQTYTQKKGLGKIKGDLNSDGKMSEYEKKRAVAIEKAVAKKKQSKKGSKCPKCDGKGCSHCQGKGYHK